jgi:DNA-binding XRE family transcriptional regulator
MRNRNWYGRGRQAAKSLLGHDTLQPWEPTRRAQLAQEFGHTLRELRVRVHLTQEQMARRGGMDRTYPSLLERGLRTPTLCTLTRLAEVLGITVTELVRRYESRL